jgi:hypothetical protein
MAASVATCLVFLLKLGTVLGGLIFVGSIGYIVWFLSVR